MAGRSLAGFNPARREDVRLFTALLDGDHIARGFRNRDVRAVLFGDGGPDQARHSAAVGRLFKRLHARQLLAKIPRMRHWRVTDRGRHVLGRVRRTVPPNLARIGGRLIPKLLRILRGSSEVRN